MENRLLHIARRYPHFLLLLPLFFFLHTLKENYAPGLTSTAIKLILFYTLAGIILGLLLYLLYRNSLNASLAAFSAMTVYFFFGSIQDFFRSATSLSFLSRYMILLPLLAAILLVIFIYLRRYRDFSRFILYINCLLILLILFDLVSLPGKVKQTSTSLNPVPLNLKTCDRCSFPDIYFIVTDEYAGKKELSEIFSFDNSAFEEELAKRGFYILNDPVSNYNATVYSMASIFSMSHLKLTSPSLVTQRDMFLCRSIINKNSLTRFLEKQGYAFHNFSFLDFAGRKKLVLNYFFPPAGMLFTATTLFNRTNKEIGFHLFTKEKTRSIKEHDLENDQEIEKQLRLVVADTARKFVYAHFNMPHYPYYFDENGNRLDPDSLAFGFSMVKKHYLGYLQYANRKFLSIIDHIKSNSKRPSIIVLLSDHGFRQFNEAVDHNYYFMNFCAISTPDSNYKSYYPGMSMVNLFRIIMNQEFGQSLPLMKDSTAFLVEPGNSH